MPVAASATGLYAAWTGNSTMSVASVAITHSERIEEAVEAALAHVPLSALIAFIAAMARRFRIDLAITVGHPAMIATGPLGGHAW